MKTWMIALFLGVYLMGSAASGQTPVPQARVVDLNPYQFVSPNAWRVVGLTTAEYDTDQMWDIDVSGWEVVVRTAGLYRVDAVVAWDENKVGSRAIRVTSNGGQIEKRFAAMPATQNWNPISDISFTRRFAVGERIGIQVYQDSPGDRLIVYEPGMSIALTVTWLSAY